MSRVVLGLGLAATAVTTTSAPASAAVVSVNLCALAGTTNPLPVTAPGLSIPIWGFGIAATPGNCSTAVASLPGPVVSVNEGDAVSIHITNALPAGHTVRFEIPGIGFGAGPTDAAVGATIARSFTASAPGTYVYQSGGDAGRQEAMGLYGMLIVRAASTGSAYDTPTTAYDVEAPLVLSALDPAFNAAPDTADLSTYLATYWLINGRAYPDTAPITAAGGQRVLLRYANAGYDNTSMLLLGMHERVLARDGHLLNNPFDADVETVPAGATEDAVATVPTSAPPSGHGFALYNRQLHVTNGSPTDPAYAPGGMLTFIKAP